jgi:L-ascorbate metabolism protein UlaG (beta-lactamase superfamily)
MRIWWRGHASFLVEIRGKKLVTDPFNAELGYQIKPVSADFVTVSHEHWDHNAVETVEGNPRIVRGNVTVESEGITIKGIASWHDKSEGRERGNNTIYKISAEGLDLVHLGDLGQVLSLQQIEEIGNVDILLLPVGGNFTIDAGDAFKIVTLLQPRIVIPMHFFTPHLSFTLAPVEEFTSLFDQVIKKPSLEVKSGDLGTDMRIIILDYLSS